MFGAPVAAGLSLLAFTSRTEGDLVVEVWLSETTCLPLLVMGPLAIVAFGATDGVV